MRFSVIMALMGWALGPLAAWAADRPASVEAQVLATGALLVDAQSGEVLFSRKADTPLPPASTVKLLTALIVWEKTGLEGTVEVVREDTLVEPSHVPLRIGEVVSVRDLTTALLVGSDNDTAMALGRKVAGSHSAFIRMMNERAKELGCVGTVFHNPNGLPSPGQVTTARDLMKIFRAVLAVPELRRICATPSFTLKTAVGAQRVKNHNKLLGVYTGMGPAKTGWTVASRHTYAASVTRNGRELWLVLLKSPNKWNDARVLFDYGFAKPQPKPRAEDPQILTVSRPAVAPKAPTAALRNEPETAMERQARHRVRQGETLWSIARNYGVTVDKIVVANSLSDPNRLQPGMDLQIP